MVIKTFLTGTMVPSGGARMLIGSFPACLFTMYSHPALLEECWKHIKYKKAIWKPVEMAVSICPVEMSIVHCLGLVDLGGSHTNTFKVPHHEVLQSKEHRVFPFPAAALKVGVDRLGLVGVLLVVGDLVRVGQEEDVVIE